MIPTSIDGTDITGATIDGTDVTEITVDGDTVFTAAPQSQILDDFADSPTVSGSSITNRDDFSTLSYQGPSPGGDFNPSGSRPDWNIEFGGASVDNTADTLTITQADSVLSVANGDFDDNVWEWEMKFNSTNRTSFMVYIHAEGTDPRSSFTTPRFQNGDVGYAVRFDSKFDFFQLVENDGSNFNVLIDDANPPGPTTFNTFKVTHESNGDFELFRNGVSVGTANDTSHTESQKNYVLFATGNQDDDPEIKFFEQYPLQ